MSPRRLLVPLAVVLGILAGVAAPNAAAQQDDGKTVWLCKPGIAPDPCRESVKTTIQHPDGTDTVVDAALPDAPPVDCFYVYPTVSNQVGPNATRTAEPEVRSIARYQAGRFFQQCRVFAPVYRQITLLSIFTGGFTDASRAIAYGDVLQAWKEYLAQDNHGRGVVLIGHSQGTGVLRRLIREEIDPDPGARRLLVSALLLGGNVTVRKGSDRGGDFQNVPLCTRDGQAGCVIAFSTFNETPPPNTRFGRIPPGIDRLTGRPADPDAEVACTNPASLAANADTPLETLVPTKPFAPGLITVGIVTVFGGLPPTDRTPWVQPRARYAGQCARVGGAHVLLIHGLGDAPKLTPAPDRTWGLHLVDVNAALGDLQRDVAAQTATFLRPAARPRLMLSVSFRRGRTRSGPCARGPVTARITGADRGLITAVAYTLRGRTTAVGAAPFGTRFALGRLSGADVLRPIVARATLSDGRTRTLTRRVRRC